MYWKEVSKCCLNLTAIYIPKKPINPFLTKRVNSNYVFKKDIKSCAGSIRECGVRMHKSSIWNTLCFCLPARVSQNSGSFVLHDDFRALRTEIKTRNAWRNDMQ